MGAQHDQAKHLQHHRELIGSLAEELKPLFDFSEQGMYVYLDDDHLAASDRFAKMLKYRDEAELLAARKTGLLEDLVAKQDQDTLAKAFNAALEKGTASEFPLAWRSKGGGTVKTRVILAPLSYRGHMFALHFISAV